MDKAIANTSHQRGLKPQLSRRLSGLLGLFLLAGNMVWPLGGGIPIKRQIAVHERLQGWLIDAIGAGYVRLSHSLMNGFRERAAEKPAWCRTIMWKAT